jgi:hypothetical protein
MRGEYAVTYSSDRRTLILKADLDRDVRFLSHYVGFIPGRFPCPDAVMCTCSTAAFHESAADFPNVAPELGDEQASFKIEQKVLEVKAALNADQPWRLIKEKRPGLYFEHLGNDVGQARFWLDLRAWVVLYPPGKRPIPDVRVWCQRLFVPGGQSQSNRRRH